MGSLCSLNRRLRKLACTFLTQTWAKHIFQHQSTFLNRLQAHAQVFLLKFLIRALTSRKCWDSSTNGFETHFLWRNTKWTDSTGVAHWSGIQSAKILWISCSYHVQRSYDMSSVPPNEACGSDRCTISKTKCEFHQQLPHNNRFWWVRCLSYHCINWCCRSVVFPNVHHIPTGAKLPRAAAAPVGPPLQKRLRSP